MMASQREAIVRLLRDDDPETVRMVKEQLAEAGSDAVGDLRDLTRCGEGPEATHAREVLAAIEDREAEGDFGLLCHFFGDFACIERAAWMLARALMPGIDLVPFETKVNSWGRQFLHRSAAAVSGRERVLLLADFMSGELGFRGNTDDYYHERNCLLPYAIETRTGIPITLTLLYTMVASRAGMGVAGVNLPGHFIARHGDVFFDPFHRGKILSCRDCAAILEKQNLPFQTGHLADASPRQTLARMLANLLYVYDLRQDLTNRDRVNGWLKALTADCCR